MQYYVEGHYVTVNLTCHSDQCFPMPGAISAALLHITKIFSSASQPLIFHRIQLTIRLIKHLASVSSRSSPLTNCLKLPLKASMISLTKNCEAGLFHTSSFRTHFLGSFYSCLHMLSFRGRLFIAMHMYIQILALS